MKTWLHRFTRLAVAAPLLLAAALLAPPPAQAADSGSAAGYRYRSIDHPDTANTALYAINARRMYVGALKELGTGAHKAIYGLDGATHRLDPEGPIGTAVESWAYTTNLWGQIGGVYLDAAGVTHGFVWSPGGRIETIDYPGATATRVHGINDRGQMIGMYTDSAGADHGWVKRNDSFENADLPGGILTVPLSINDLGQIVGEFIQTPGTVGFGYVQQPDGRFTLHTAQDSPPEQTFFISITNRGHVLGAWFDLDPGYPHNFIRKHGRYVPFNLPDDFGAIYVQAETMNERGDIVGYWFDANWVAHGFLAEHTGR